MKSTIVLVILLTAMHVSAQSDSIFYPNGQLMATCQMKDGKKHGKLKMWYESGQISAVEIWKNGKEVRSTRYFETGTKSSFTTHKKLKVKMKMWHPNGKIWDTSISKYSRSIEKEYDSTGVMTRKTIQKKGASLACNVSEGSEVPDSLNYKDASCSVPWGNAYWRNGSWVDEKGRDLAENYAFIQTWYFADGKKKKEKVWDRNQLKYFIREWNENGFLVSERLE
ncbi:MAG: toxin-antitoxin system YwqK family antitoxin [Fluviicola sp.]